MRVAEMVGIMFEFEINNDKWQIEEKSKEELKELYEAEMEEKAYFVFGVTIKSQHIIYINKDMCEEQKIKTLKHELTHCYIWEHGLYNVMDVNEEVICDIVASSNDFINEVVEQYKNNKETKRINIEVDKITQIPIMLCNEKEQVRKWQEKVEDQKNIQK